MKATKIFMMAALALTFAACSNDDNDLAQQPAEQPANNEITITATVSSDDATTRALSPNGSNIASTWETTDQFAILFNDGSSNVKRIATVVAPISGSTVTITFTIPSSLASNTACTIVYPASAANATNTGADVATALATQDGTIGNCPEVRVGTATINKDNHSLSDVTKLVAQNAIFKFTTKNSGGTATIDVKPLTVTIGSDNYVITPASATSELYVALPAVSSQTVSFSATGSDSKTYICSKASVTFAAGKYYQSTLKMALAYPLLSATTSDYGKVVCAAGHLHDAKTAVPAGCTAVGILGKVTSTGHGLILALKNATNQNWNTINGWNSVTTYAGTTLKVLPDNAARGNNLKSYTTLGTTTVSNWAVAQKSDYVAIFQNLGSTNNDEGYTYDGNVNAYITTGVGGTAISGTYWSATQYDDDDAWYFSSDYWFHMSKATSNRVRPVLGF